MLRKNGILRLATAGILLAFLIVLAVTPNGTSSAVSNMEPNPTPRQILENMILFRRITLVVDGTASHLLTSALTVDEAIRSAGVVMEPWDKSEPSLGNTIHDGMSIRVIRVDRQTVEEEQVVPYRTVRVQTKALSRGESRELRSGVNGKQLNTYELIYENGRLAERNLLKSETLVERVDRLIEEGVIATISRGGQTLRYSKVIEVVATGYDAGYESTGKRPGDPEYGMTRSGRQAVEGVTIAVDPRIIPLLSRVYVEGLDSYGKQYSGQYIAMDTGSAIKGNRIDIYFESRAEALRFGRRKMRVYVLETK